MSLLCVEWVFTTCLTIWIRFFFIIFNVSPKTTYRFESHFVPQNRMWKMCCEMFSLMAITREEDKKIVRNTRMKFKDLLLKIIADLHFSTRGFCVWSFASTEKKTACTKAFPLKSIMVLWNHDTLRNALACRWRFFQSIDFYCRLHLARCRQCDLISLRSIDPLNGKSFPPLWALIDRKTEKHLPGNLVFLNNLLLRHRRWGEETKCN